MMNVLWVRASLWSRLVIYFLLIAAAVWTVIPFLWAIVNSVKTVTDTFQPGALIPFVTTNETVVVAPSCRTLSTTQRSRGSAIRASSSALRR